MAMRNPRRPPQGSVPVEAGENFLYPRHGKAGGNVFSADPRQPLPLQKLRQGIHNGAQRSAGFAVVLLGIAQKAGQSLGLLAVHQLFHVPQVQLLMAKGESGFAQTADVISVVLILG